MTPMIPLGHIPKLCFHALYQVKQVYKATRKTGPNFYLVDIAL